MAQYLARRMDNKAKKRKWTPPEDSTLLHLAQKENFAIFLLKGRGFSPDMRKVLPAAIISSIVTAQNAAIAHIKETQRLRMEKNKKKGKKR